MDIHSSDDCMPQAMRRDHFSSKKREICKLYFPPDNSNSTPMLLIFSSPFLCLFPFTLCPVLEFAQTPLDCRVM